MTMSRAKLLKLPPSSTVALYLMCYLVLDWVTFIPEFATLGITPWNPAAGLALALVLLKGAAYAPLLGISPLLGDAIVRHVPLPWWVLLTEAALVGAGYAAALAYLNNSSRVFDRSLRSLTDLLQLVAATIFGAVVVAAAYVGVLVAADLLPASEFTASALRYWVGDVIGITVVTPFLLILMTHERPPRLGTEAALQTAAILAVILIVLGLGVRFQSQLFYLLFLPIVWVAVRSGLEGVSAALVLMQVGIMAALHMGRHDSVDVTEFQAVMLVLVFAGLAIGLLTSERERAERRLRLQQDAVARAARIASMGNLSTTVAHEVNQPLTAIANYTRVALRSLEATPARPGDAKDAIEKVLAQVERATGVIKRVREFISVGRTELSPHDAASLINETLDLLAPAIEAHRAVVDVDIPRTLPAIRVDRIQIQQVLTNVVKNALEALGPVPAERRRLTISAQTTEPGWVCITVRDLGPGLPPDFELDPMAPSATTKPDGLGIGLALSRGIIEAHGGNLTIQNADPGALVRFTIKTIEGEPYGRSA